MRGYLIAIAVVQGSRFIKRLYVRKFANNINRSMKQVLYANLVRKDKVELEQAGTGTLMTKAISDVDACAEGMRKFTTEIFDTGIALLAYAVSATGAGGAGPCRPGSAVFFPAGEPVVQPGPVRAGAGGAAAGGREVRPVPLGCDHRLLGRGAALLLLGRDRRSFVYIWDYVNYINKQYNAEAAFLQSPGAGFRYIFDSFTEELYQL